MAERIDKVAEMLAEVAFKEYNKEQQKATQNGDKLPIGRQSHSRGGKNLSVNTKVNTAVV